MAGRRKRTVADTKELILDAAYEMMREEGYAAVTSRRIAEKAGSKSMPIHYHFGSMDDLFLALYRRSEQKYLSALVKSISSKAPLKELWRLGQDPVDSQLVIEYLAMANHRESMRDEVARSGDRTRSISTAIVATSMRDAKVDFGPISPAIAAFILEAINRTLVADRTLGISTSHDEVVSFVERLLQQLEPTTSARDRRHGNSNPPGTKAPRS
jgi:AcrR family transcriptional regulator